jgi:hypothetical protein
MVKKQEIAFLLVGTFFLTTVSFAQSEKPISGNLESDGEVAVKTEKQANTKTDYEKEGALTKEELLKELQKLKEEVKRLHSEIENIRAGKLDITKLEGGYGSLQGKESVGKQDIEALKSQEKTKYLQQLLHEQGGLTKEKAINLMQKLKEDAIKSGDMEKAKEIHSEMQEVSKMNESSFSVGESVKEGSTDSSKKMNEINSKYGASMEQTTGDMSKGGSTMQQGMQGGPMNQGQKGSSNMQGGPQGTGGYSQQKGQPSGMSSPSGDMSKGSSMMTQGQQGMQSGSMTQGQQGMQGGPMMQGQKGGSNMQQGGSQQGAPQGSGGYSSEQEESSYEGSIKTEKQANTKSDYEKEGTPTKEKVLKELQKLKEKAIATGNMEEAKKLHAEIENIRAGKSDYTKSSGGDGPTQSKESLDKQDDNP